MAKVMIEADTSTGEISAVVNGEKIDNVTSLNMYIYGDDDNPKYPKRIDCDIQSGEKNDDGVMKITRICCSTNSKVQSGELKVKAHKIKDLVIVEDEPTIEKLFACIRKG